MPVKVLRGAASTGEYTGEGRKVLIRPRAPYFLDIVFEIDSKGGGATTLSVRVEPDAFKEVADIMMQVDPDAAIKAFGNALLAGAPKDQSTN